MLNKKLSKILGPILGVMVFMTSLGVGQVKVLADDKVSETSVTCENTSYDKEEDYSFKINKSVEQNGFKVTLDNVIGTKHNLKVQVKIQNDKAFNQDKMDNIISKITFDKDGKSIGKSGGRWIEYIDDNTALIHITEELENAEYIEKGDLRVDIVIPSYKINAGIDAYVDFSQSFKNACEKELSIKVPELNLTLNKLESDIMGTELKYALHCEKIDCDKEDTTIGSSMVLKVGDRMYRIDPAGSYSFDDKETKGSYRGKAATYEKLKDANEFSIIPINCDMSYDEVNKIYGNNIMEHYEKLNSLKDILNNVRYLKSFEFADGTKGEIYNIERNDNTVKVYCRGNTDKAGLLMANNMYMNYEFDDYNVGLNDMYDWNKYMSFYKDKNEDFGYIVEFNNVDKDKILNLDIYSAISQIDRFKLGNEINLFK
ncbi:MULTISPECIES: DUF4179 domain-containing protein [unclassified Clostridium]|uniref:DUF4179 domain-containing protein n=1 Tax=unclassified Clostridium TaxID=2614128 RepID=UPI0013F6BD72|nr:MULTISPECIES: DUF4179 domain-containing protein [unclassified Clostridium]NFT07483.1 DUF4179 domain-containing protein [Clostridium botulinum]